VLSVLVDSRNGEGDREMKNQNDLLTEFEKLRKKAQRLARAERKHVGKDITRFEGFCKGQWLAYDWAASRIKDILDKHKSLAGKV
jgi:hypothetical protein